MKLCIHNELNIPTPMLTTCSARYVQLDCYCIYSQIRAWDINYWNKSFKDFASTEGKGYPPRIRLQLYTGLEGTFPIEFIGCTNDSNLNYELLLPSGTFT